MLQIVPSLLGSQLYLTWPNQPIGWIGLAILVGLLGWVVWLLRDDAGSQLRRRWAILLALFLLTFPASLFLGLRLPGESLPIPTVPAEAISPVLMLLAAIPWVLAGGLVGALPAAGLAFVGGLLIALFETHSPFTPIEAALMALLFSFLVRQRYRTWFYRVARHPIMAALGVMVVSIPVLIVSSIASTNGSVAVRLDYAFTQSWMVILAEAGKLLVAGAAGELVFLFLPASWGVSSPLRPSPSEVSLQTRFFFYILPLVVALVLTLVIGDWLVAGNAARRMIRERLSSTAQVAANSLPYFLETGENLILTLATPDLLEDPETTVEDTLSNRIRSVPYFRQLVLFDARGEFVASYPADHPDRLNLTQEELSGINLALKGINVQHYLIPPLGDETSAQVSFMAAVMGQQGQAEGVLLGRTDFNTNPFVQPAIQALSGMADLGGEGIILSDNGTILYDPNVSQVMTSYLGKRPENADFFNELSPSNTRQYVFYQPVMGRPWAVVLTVPAQVAQQMALDIAVPLLVMLMLIALLAFLFVRIGLSSLTSSLRVLAHEASTISLGQLDHPL